MTPAAKQTSPPQAKCHNFPGLPPVTNTAEQTSRLAESQGIHGLIATYTGEPAGPSVHGWIVCEAQSGW